MNINLWIYTSEEVRRVSASMILLGADVLRSAKIIKELDHLKLICRGLDNKTISPQYFKINEFIFEYLIDCIKILIFFENYMKAELISKGFCVHKIKKEVKNFEETAKRQFKEPITIKEINEIHPFEHDNTRELILHNALKETTLGFNELIRTPSYLSQYQFDNNILNFIKELNIQRNKLHFHDNIHFSISHEFIMKLENVKEFAAQIIHERIGAPLER